MLYGTITEFCTLHDCPVMSAGPKYVQWCSCLTWRYEYLWADGHTVKKPIKCSAPGKTILFPFHLYCISILIFASLTDLRIHWLPDDMGPGAVRRRDVVPLQGVLPLCDHSSYRRAVLRWVDSPVRSAFLFRRNFRQLRKRFLSDCFVSMLISTTHTLVWYVHVIRVFTLGCELGRRGALKYFIQALYLLYSG